MNLKTIGKLQVGDKLHIKDNLLQLDIRSHWQPIQRSIRNAWNNTSNRLHLLHLLRKIYVEVVHETRGHIYTIDNTPYVSIQSSTQPARLSALISLRSFDKVLPITIGGLNHLCVTYKHDCFVYHELKLHVINFNEIAETIHSYVLKYNPQVVTEYLLKKKNGICNLYDTNNISE